MTSNTPPGWYYAEGDPPNTQRYWDGVSWQGEPQLVGAAQSVAPPATGFGQTYVESSQATTALILSIVGIVCCAVAAPVAWYMGNTEVQAIDAGRRDPTNRGTANAAKIIGIVGTVLAVIGIVGYGVLVALA